MTKLNRDDRGLSLVELIVALLILTIIFTPTFSAFSVSLKLTTEAKNEFYGATVADNIMEVLKYKMSNGDNMAEIKDSLSSLAGQVMESKRVPAPTVGSKEVDGETVKTITYFVPAYTEGTAEYKAVIELVDYSKTASGRHNLNEKQFANMSAFNDTTTALINPSAIAGGFDSAVADYFGRLHSTYFNNLDQQEVAYVNQHNIDLAENYSYEVSQAIFERRPTPTPYPTAPRGADYTDPIYAYYYWQMPDSRPKLTSEAMMSHISKDITLKLEYKDTRLGYQYILNSTTEYVLKNITAGSNIRGSVGFCDSENATLSMNCNGYCDEVYYEDLNNIYILYTPLGYFPGNTVKLGHEKIVIDNEMSTTTIEDKKGHSQPLNLFIVVQVESGKTLDVTEADLQIDCTGLGDRPIKVYSQVPFSFAGGATTSLRYGYEEDVREGGAYVDTSIADQKYSLITASKTAERIYEATVTVYDVNNNIVATLNSALTE